MHVCSKAVEYAEKYVERFFVTHDTDLLADPQRYQDWKISQLESMLDHKKPTFFFHEHNAVVCFLRHIIMFFSLMLV